jgi:hypothetical protein
MYQVLTGGTSPGWAWMLGFAATAVFILISLRHKLIHSARLADDAVEVVTGAGSRRIPLADMDRPSRFTRSTMMLNNIRIVNAAGGWFAVPGYSRRAAEFLDDLASRTGT